MNKFKEHAEFVEALGGAAQVCAYIKKATGQSITTQAVSHWKTKRGIAWRYRALLASWAATRKIRVPRDFLGPEV